jgi:hypothetical protein
MFVFDILLSSNGCIVPTLNTLAMGLYYLHKIQGLAHNQADTLKNNVFLPILGVLNFKRK